MSEYTTIAVAYGDGIGPEIMESTLMILKNAGAKIKIETIEIGEGLYLKGNSSGISSEAWDVIDKTKVLLKAPITTPQGSGYKSLNVTFRKTLGLFANIRPCRSFSPFIASNHDKMDMIIFRENEEDLYAGIEYKVTPEHNLSYKIITRKGSEKIIRYAFEYASRNNRKKVTCLIKDNIMKIADGAFHQIFNDVAKEYPGLLAEAMIVDIGAARIASRPQDFDVVVTLNLYGDIVSDIAAEVSGSVGLAGSSNIGNECAMFEAVHGSAPDIAGKNIANPSGLLNASILMLEYIGQADIAAKIYNAWLKTIEEGIHTADIYKEGKSKEKVGTKEFAQAVIYNLGKAPERLEKKLPSNPEKIKISISNPAPVEQQLIGVDLYIGGVANIKLGPLANKLEELSPNMKLYTMSVKGLKIWPCAQIALDNLAEDFICCRFIGFQDTGVKQDDIINLMQLIAKNNLNIISSQSLYNYNGKAGYTMSQGE